MAHDPSRSMRYPSLLALVLVLLAGLSGCTGRGPARADRTQAAGLRDTIPRVQIAPVHRADTGSPSFPSYLDAERQADLVAETEGDVLEVRVREGARVAAGDTLLRIDDRDERLAVERDEAELRWAESEVRRLEQLAGEGHVSPREIEQAQLQLGRARAALGLSRADLDRCWIRAPIAGLVWMVRVEPHRRVAKGETLCRVTDPSEVRVSVYLPEGLRSSVRVGQWVRLECARARTPMSAVVTRIDPVTDPASGTFRVTAGFRRRAGDPEPGADVRLLLPGPTAGPGVMLPARANVEGDGDSTWVWRCEGDRVHRVPVRLGAVIEGAFLVEAGLPEGAMVVVETNRPLTEGAPVRVEKGP